MQRNNGDMIIYSSTYVSFESTVSGEPLQFISNIYIYLYVSDQSSFIGSESYNKAIIDFNFGKQKVLKVIFTSALQPH